MFKDMNELVAHREAQQKSLLHLFKDCQEKKDVECFVGLIFTKIIDNIIKLHEIKKEQEDNKLAYTTLVNSIYLLGEIIRMYKPIAEELLTPEYQKMLKFIEKFNYDYELDGFKRPPDQVITPTIKH